ncbi:MAG: hypothetical protein FJY29_02015 [Betaproteobacteria bacterium]|nr:hypothetical protein [Betaproteobacteria bacterium]
MDRFQFTSAALKIAILTFAMNGVGFADQLAPNTEEPSNPHTAQEINAPPHIPEWNDCEWAWSDLEVDAAHQFLSKNGISYPGKGIRVAHIDTGVIPFPMLQRHADSDKGFAGLYYISEPATRDAIFNFVQPHLAPLDNNDKGLNFGHGTETASLIVGSMAETNVSGWSLRGVAPFSILFPIKVTDSVVMVGNISTGGTADLVNLLGGIAQASQLGAHVITISLGAIFDAQQRIRKAIESALDAGSIVIAAGGQTLPVDIIPLPAKLPGVVAVTASTRAKNHWKPAFSSKSIAWAAPGENVCHLGLQERKLRSLQPTNTQSYDLKTRGGSLLSLSGLIRMSSGTSYSTAFTAGAATLWLQQHNPVRLAHRYGQKNISRLFLAVAKTFAMDIPEGWDTQRHGAGILNIRRLLQAPLPCTASDSDQHCAVKLSRFLTSTSR